MDENNELDPLAAAAAAQDSAPHPILSAEQLAAAKAKARKMIEEERVKTATAAVIEEEKQRLRREEGFTTGVGAKDEMVMVTLNLAEHSAFINLSGTPYWHGHTYTVPRHVADTLREIQDRGHRHQEDVDGKGRYDAYRRSREDLGIPTLINMRTHAIANAPPAAAAGAGPA